MSTIRQELSPNPYSSDKGLDSKNEQYTEIDERRNKKDSPTTIEKVLKSPTKGLTYLSDKDEPTKRLRKRIDVGEKED